MAVKALSCIWVVCDGVEAVNACEGEVWAVRVAMGELWDVFFEVAAHGEWVLFWSHVAAWKSPR